MPDLTVVGGPLLLDGPEEVEQPFCRPVSVLELGDVPRRLPDFDLGGRQTLGAQDLRAPG